jgi:peptide/nickel transport system substrate-binding protein
MRRILAMAVLVLGAATVVGGASGGSVPEGGVFRVAGAPDAIDPAITLDAYDALQATCAKLMNYPDRPMPEGTRVVPEVAARYPAVSRNGTTFTFTIRKGFRFSTGAPVTARSFAHEIDRVLSPTTNSPWTQYVQDIVGARAVMAGQATNPSGLQVRGDKLIVRLTHPARDFPARTAFSAFCAVPADLPVTAEGVGAPLPGAGPYTITQFVPGQSLVLKRNPFYHGPRPHHVNEIDYLSVPDAVAAVETGAADFDEDTIPADLPTDPRYRGQLHSVPGITVRFIVLNSARPLFRNNARLRQAVNFAIDRKALIEARGGPITGVPSDQNLPTSMPGFVDGRIYPLRHPDLKTARALAHGHTRGGTARLYIKDDPVDIAQSQIIARDLRPIGIRVVVKILPGPALFQLLLMRGTPPFDMTLFGYGPDYWDPAAMLNVLFDGRQIGRPYSSNVGRFDSPKYNALLGAADKLTGSARYRAYGKLDVNLARNAAPMVPYENERVSSFVSKRVGCIVVNPFLDLAAVCLK